MDFNSFVGEKLGPYECAADAEMLRKFAESVGARDRKVAPPTYLTKCREGEFNWLEKLGVPLARVLHGEQEYVYHAAIRAGDTLSYVTALAQVLEKRGMHFLIFETEVSSRVGRVATARSTLVVRGGA